MPPQITVIGSANVDYIMQVPALPKVGQTVTEGIFTQTFGGKGANQAVAAVRAGGSVTFVAALGHDETAKQYHAQLTRDGIDTSHVTLEPDAIGGSALVMFDKQGDNYLTVAPGSNRCVTPQRVEAVQALIARSDWIVLQQEIPIESNRAVISLAERHGRPVMLNYAPADDLELKPGPAIHALIVNESEAAALVGAPVDPTDSAACRQVASDLREAGGHRFVVVTLGKSGVVYADETGTHDIAGFVVQAKDTTAAGDTFCGSLAVALGEGMSLPQAIRFASAAAAISVTTVGAQDSIPDRAAIDSFLAELAGECV